MTTDNLCKSVNLEGGSLLTVGYNSIFMPYIHDIAFN